MDNLDHLDQQTSQALDTLQETFPNYGIEQLLLVLTHARSLEGVGSAHGQGSSCHNSTLERAIFFLLDDVAHAEPKIEKPMDIERPINVPESDYQHSGLTSHATIKDISTAETLSPIDPDLVNQSNKQSNINESHNLLPVNCNNLMSSSQNPINNDNENEYKSSNSFNSETLLDSTKIKDFNHELDKIQDVYTYNDSDNSIIDDKALSQSSMKCENNVKDKEESNVNFSDILSWPIDTFNDDSVLDLTNDSDRDLINNRVPDKDYLPKTNVSENEMKKNKSDPKHPPKGIKKMICQKDSSDENRGLSHSSKFNIPKYLACDTDSASSSLEDIPTFIQSDINSQLSRQDKKELSLKSNLSMDCIIHQSQPDPVVAKRNVDKDMSVLSQSHGSKNTFLPVKSVNKIFSSSNANNVDACDLSN